MNETDREGAVRILCMRGLPRSGKSTVAKRISERFGHPIVSRDAIRLSVHGTAYLQSEEEMVSYIEENMVQALAYAGHECIIVDECNVDAVKAEARVREWFDSTKFDVTVEFAIVDVPADECRERARACGQLYLLPVIDRMQMAWTD